MKNYLIADIGGTNCNIAYIHIDKSNKVKNNFKIIKEINYKTINIKNFEDVFNDFINTIKDEYNITLKNAVLAVPGQKKNDIFKMINVKTELNLKKLIKQTALISIDTINDFDAIAFAIPILQKQDLLELKKGTKIKNSPTLVIGPGTGLGISILTTCNNANNKYVVLNSEGGHSELSIRNDKELELLKFLQKKHKREYISWEDVISGKGINSIYEFLTNKKETPENISNLQKEKNKDARETFDIFYKFLARFISSQTNNFLNLGSIYIAGGIIEKNIDFDKKIFIKEFKNNYFLRLIDADIPIYLIKDYNVSILGLINYCMNK